MKRSLSFPIKLLLENQQQWHTHVFFLPLSYLLTLLAL